MIVAFEGIDACGKSTQIKMLMKAATEKGWITKLFSYPNYDSDTGKKILELLKAPERDPLVLQCLMAANRYEQQHEIEGAQSLGRLVILDRYWLSGYVYGLTDGLPFDWLMDVHFKLTRPQQWIILDIPVEESFRRRPVRDDAYEANHERLEKARVKYRGALSWLRDSKVIDAIQSPEDIHARVLSCLEL